MIIFVLVACIALASCQRNEFYIKSSVSDTCLEGEQCLTLSQFTARNIESNVTLNFYPGNHTLSATLTFQNNLMVRILKKPNHSANSTIQCTHSGRIDFNNTELANIYNIEFRNCRLQVNHTYHVDIVNSTFLFNSYGQFQRAYLGLAFKWGYGQAGVIVSQASSITLFGVSFERNRAELGAAIFAVDSAIEIWNSSFENNRALCIVTRVCLGGVLYSYNSGITIQFSNFQNNSVIGVNDISDLAIGGVFALFESSVSMSNSYFVSNVAVLGSGGVIYAQTTGLHIIASSFISNRAAQSGGVIRSPQATSIIDSNNHYEGNTAGFEGGVMSLDQVKLKLTESKFLFNSAKTFGGAIKVNIGILQFFKCEMYGNIAGKGGSAITIESVSLCYVSSCNFTANTVIEKYYYGGAICAVGSHNIRISDSIFTLNEGSSGGVLSVRDSSAVSIKFSIFTSNLAFVGGVIHVSRDKTVLIENCTFSNNSASETGGTVSATSITNFTIASSAFESNRAKQGGVVYATNYVYIYMQNTIFFNNAASLGMMYFIESTCIVSGFSEFMTNIGSIFAYNSNITIAGNATFINSYPPSTNSTTFSAFQSKIILSGLCNFNHNFAESGGAVYATESQVYITGNTALFHNTAEKNGGAILLYKSHLECQDNGKLLLLGNIAGERGGAIHAISSSIRTTFIILDISFDEYARISQIIFTENYAIKGGAVSLEVNAKLYIFIKINYDKVLTDKQPFIFERNEANYGGAIYVDDNTNSGICASSSSYVQSSSTECFLQALSLHGNYAINYTYYVNFTNNRGNVSGADLYGGLLDRCTVSPFAEVHVNLNLKAIGLKQTILLMA